MENTIEVGDRVHARLYDQETGNVALQEFVVSSIKSKVYLGGALPCDTKNGWTVELLEKSLENLNLPQTISEITAYDVYGTPHHLIGKNDNWMTQDGAPFPVRQIFKWVAEHV